MAHPEKFISCSWLTPRGCPAATLSMCSTKSCPVMASLMGCSTCKQGMEKEKEKGEGVEM